MLGAACSPAPAGPAVVGSVAVKASVRRQPLSPDRPPLGRAGLSAATLAAPGEEQLSQSPPAAAQAVCNPQAPDAAPGG